jgi:hypothetical protein
MCQPSVEQSKDIEIIGLQFNSKKGRWYTVPRSRIQDKNCSCDAHCLKTGITAPLLRRFLNFPCSSGVASPGSMFSHSLMSSQSHLFIKSTSSYAKEGAGALMSQLF